jgi:Spy/CpxP family protein refolding chaperone
MTSALGIALALGVSISAAVLADSTQSPGDNPGWKGRHQFEDALKLTDAQKTQMRDLRKQQRDAMQATMKDLMQAHKDLRAQVFSDNPDEGQIQALKTKIAGLQAQQLSARIDLDRKISAILTPDQRKTMASMPPFGMHRGHHGGWGHHGQSPADGSGTGTGPTQQ